MEANVKSYALELKTHFYAVFLPHAISYMSLVARKPVFFATRVDSNPPAQLQKLGRGLKFRI